MTYPPPPPDQPGAGGWPAGDPHESPTIHDPNVLGQPPGYAPQYQAPQYQAPGYQQYQGPGYQAPGYQPPGYPAPGYYQQPGMPPQPPRRSYTGWIIGGVAGGVVLVMLLGLGVVLALRAGDSEDPEDPSGPEIALPTGEPFTPSPAAPAEPGGGTYAFVPDLCTNLDFSPVFDIVPTSESPEEWYTVESDSSFSSHSSCTIGLDDGRAIGSLSISVDVHEDPEQTVDLYEIMIDTSISVPDSVEDVNTPWEQGQLWLGDDLADEAARILARDANLAMSVQVWLFSAPGTQDQLAAAVTQIAEEILAVHAQ